MKKFIQIYNLIMESINVNDDFFNNALLISRPNRMKTPPNNYGSTGYNAKKFNLYIQDEAKYIFQDKYGKIKGEATWENIIGIGRAMWKACDEILGERITMEEIIRNWLKSNPEIEQQCTDINIAIDFTKNVTKFYESSYIILWTWWILINIIEGKKYTNNFISSCISTFKDVKNLVPVTTTILLNAANIDIDNY